MKLIKFFIAALLSLDCISAIAESDLKDKAFWASIQQYGQAQTSSARDEIGKEIWATYGKKNAVVVIDTSGFTLRAIDEGIISTLVVIQELRSVVSKIMRESPGRIIKLEADNAFLRFDNPQDALDTCIKINQVWNNSFVNKGHKHPIKLSMGIDYGPILILKADAFSEVLNIASKLGEDTAEGDDILITKRAYQDLKQPVAAEEKNIDVSNVNITYYKIKKTK